MNNFSFDPDGHIYRLDGAEIPSVTQIIRFLSADVDKSRPWLRDEAARRGTVIHETCAAIDFGEPDAILDIPNEFSGYLAAYQSFLRDYSPEWDKIEYSAWGTHQSYPFAGTIDRAGTMRGKNVILDIKTGTSGNNAMYSAQLTGYHLLLLDQTKDIPDLYILRLSRDGTYQLKQQRIDINLWCACFTIHNTLGGKRK